MATQVGSQLQELVFGVPEISTLFRRTRGAAADRGRQLLIRLMAAPHTVAAFPWELMTDSDGGTHRFLTLSPDAHIVRLARVCTYPVRQVLIKPPLRMLLVLRARSDRSTANTATGWRSICTRKSAPCLASWHSYGATDCSTSTWKIGRRSRT